VPRINASLSEIRRVLRSDGFAVLSAPLDMEHESTIEDNSCVTAACRKKTFMQWDHVRILGRDTVDLVRSFFVEVAFGQIGSFYRRRHADYAETFGNNEYDGTGGSGSYMLAFRSHQKDILEKIL
jgi:hypothetical protein